MSGFDLKIERIKRRIKQIDVCVKTGIHASRLSLIENNYASPKPEELDAIKRALGLDDSGMGVNCNVAGVV